ncbi:siderophore-interacting protein [Sphaerisporangium sp. TRM90804]|uniref:siderophore-interacting protein n=1 Tax=Sphaerisporangium sp. TRM90804 TaxID=3031113 RepID=UPI00244A111A|nr:siderophore-interacting protein [Sphaerisporangium sp. TRM90804]MDH2425959.1 siderophore-interacting protein [Sphaerisporangium sp. TRM90804]
MGDLPVSLITVTAVRRLTPRMARVTFGGDAFAATIGGEPDQQVKLYFPRPGQTVPVLPEPGPDGDLMRWYAAYNAIPADERPWMRSFTVRAHHPGERTVDIDFVLHGDAGPASRWAGSATPGDTLGVFGPSAYFARPEPLSGSIAAADWVLLAGDAAALPAIGTLIEALPEGARAVAYVEVADAAEEQRFDTRGDVTVHWLHRGHVPAGHGDALVDAVREARFPSGSMFAWLGGEAGAVRALRRHLVGDRGVAKRAIDFTGYWRPRMTQDDAPTEDDLAEARERLADAAAPGGNA